MLAKEKEVIDVWVCWATNKYCMHDAWSLRRKKIPHIGVALLCGDMINPEKKDVRHHQDPQAVHAWAISGCAP